MRNRNNYDRQLITENNQFQMKNLIIVIIIILTIFIAFYFITKYVLINKKDNSPVLESVIQNEKIIFGQLFDRNESEYYVLAYEEESKSKDIYNMYIDKYKQKETHLSFYEINLNEAFNKKFISDNSNITNDINTLMVSDETLFKIKEGKIEEYKVGSSNINSYLKEISE